MNRGIVIFILGVLTTLASALLLGALAINRGVIDMAADAPHHPFIYRLIETARERSIKQHAEGIAVPADLADGERLRRGAGNYEAMCVGCHLSPAMRSSEIRQGLYPAPPDLTLATEDATAARQFWVIKHGIKGSAMPAWSKGGIEDGAIWDLVALLQRLSVLSTQSYQELVERSDGHSHGGVEPAPATMQEREEAADHPHDDRATEGHERKPADHHDHHEHHH
jgi:mono/diheme cytochrome c family protein